MEASSFSPPPSDQKHSSLGIASFVLALVGILTFCAVFVAIAVVGYEVDYSLDAQSLTDQFNSTYAILAILGLAFYCGPLLNLVGAGLGVGALIQKDTRKVLSITGLVLNILAICVVFALLIIGNFAPG